MFKWLKNLFTAAPQKAAQNETADELKLRNDDDVSEELIGVYNSLDEARAVAFNKAAQCEDEHEGLFVRDQGMCIGIWAPEFTQYHIHENNEGKYVVIGRVTRHYYG